MTEPTNAQIRRWRKYLAAERAEAAIYLDLAERRSGAEREILLGLAAAEARHEQHWVRLLGNRIGAPRRPDARTRMLGFLARHLGFLFVLVLAQRSETRSPYAADSDATEQMAADEHIHGEVLRSLASRGRTRLSGSFRAAVFGANDGLVSNLALVLGIGATGAPPGVVLFTGIAGLLSGALSMGAGEYVSVKSQRELLAASHSGQDSQKALVHLDVNANELALVYRARGEDEEQAATHARAVLQGSVESSALISVEADSGDAVGYPLRAAVSSFLFFASGALVAILPYLFGVSGLASVILASSLVGLALLGTGAVVGVLSGAPPLSRAIRQLLIGYGAAGITYLLGLLFGATFG